MPVKTRHSIVNDLVKSNQRWALAPFIVLFIYIAIRANVLSFTHDESLSFAIITAPNTAFFSANNHLLNTFLMWLSHVLLGDSELALRLPNVLAFMLYSAGAMGIFASSKDNWAFLLGAGIALLNPYLLEFFSLARGYGLSLGFIMVSLFYVVRGGFQVSTYSALLKDFAFAALFASLAVFSNLSTINFLIGVIVIFNIKFWRHNKRLRSHSKQRTRFFYLLCGAGIPLILGIIHLLALKVSGQLYFGTSSFDETVSSLIASSIYFETYPSWIIPVIKVALLLCWVAGIVSIVRTRSYMTALSLMTALLTLLIFALFFEHFVFSVGYPLERTALYFIPVFSVFAYFLFRHLSTHYSWVRRSGGFFVVILLCPFVMNFIAGANTSYTKTWRYDAHTKESMALIRDHWQAKEHKAIIYNHWLFEPTINYYITTWRLNAHPANRKGIASDADFIYDFDDGVTTGNHTVLRVYTDIGTRLLRQAKGKE